jgi:hypothetical protein
MKLLKNIIAAFAMLMLLLVSSCKKDTLKIEPEKLGTFTCQNKSYEITSADYRKGNGNGAWIYLTSSDLNTVQIRFAGIADYAIPDGKIDFVNPNYTIPLIPNKSFMGGQVSVNNMLNEYNTASVTITKNGDKHKILLNASTANGSVKADFEGILTKM